MQSMHIPSLCENCRQGHISLTNGCHVCPGGLRLQPASPALWAALGNTEATPAAQEQCLHRALQLDPRNAGAWTALGRLYAEKGHGSQADACLMQARSHDPDAPAPWEAMGAMAGASATGTCCLSNVNISASLCKPVCLSRVVLHAGLIGRQ